FLPMKFIPSAAFRMVGECRLSVMCSHDITSPRSAPLELQATVPDYMVPFAPILQHGEEPFSMFVDLQNKYDWVLQPVVGYPSVDRLIEVVEAKDVRTAAAKVYARSDDS